MRNRRKLFLTAFTAGALLLLLMAWLRPREPVHQGRRLSYWTVEAECTNAAHAQRARVALHAIGREAVPFLLGKAKDNSSPSKRFYREVWFRMPGFVQRRVPRPLSRDEVLTKIAHALHGLGPSAGAALMEAMKDENTDVRCAAAWSFPYAHDSEAGVRWLTRMLQTPDYDSKQSAAALLATLGTNAWPAVPTLLAVMQHDEFDYVRETAASSLARLAGCEMASVAPRLKGSLNDPLPSVRAWSAVALWRINRDTNLVPVLVRELNTAPGENGACYATIVALGEAGPLAKSAVPAIRAQILAYDPQRALPEGADALIQAAREALSRIDPEAVSDVDGRLP